MTLNKHNVLFGDICISAVLTRNTTNTIQILESLTDLGRDVIHVVGDDALIS